MMKKLGQKTKLEDKEDVEVEKAAEHVEVDSKPKVFSVCTAGKYSLFSEEELQHRQQLRPAAVSKEPRAVVIEKVDMPEDDFQTQQRSPLTILSDDEGYLLEEDQPIDEAEGKHETYGEFFISEKQLNLIRRRKGL